MKTNCMTPHGFSTRRGRMGVASIVLFILAFLLLGAWLANAQPSVDSSTVSTNLEVVLYGDHFDHNNKFGGGGMLLYNIAHTDNGFGAAAGVGMDWAGQWYSVSANATGKYNRQLSAKLDLTAYVIAGAGTSLSGAGGGNGNFETAEGGGIHFNYDLTSKINGGAGLGYIRRQGAGDFNGGSEIFTLSGSYKSDGILYPVGKIVQVIANAITKSP